MFNLSTYYLKVLLHVFVIVSVIIVFCYLCLTSDSIKQRNVNVLNLTNDKLSSALQYANRRNTFYNVWLIFTKVYDRSPLKYKFSNLVINLLNTSSVPLIFNIIVDKASEKIALREIARIETQTYKTVDYVFYDFKKAAKAVQDILPAMTAHFSSKPGTYYSDALFYLSLGLHHIAPEVQKKAVMLDCDLYFKNDIALLFKEFDSFKETELFGLAPELTPVYRHVLHIYRSKHNTTFGDYIYPKNASSRQTTGFQGYNSGVILLNLSAIRKSKFYAKLLRNDTINDLTEKYTFRGHLGDQDFYTLIGYEYPNLIHDLHCGFNRQLCTWWREHGYKEVFDYYFNCSFPTIVLHGNCNSRIPK